MVPITQAKNLKGKVVLVRVDFNVPIEKKKVLDDTRLIASLPTIEYLIEKGAKIVLMTHIGRPRGKVVASLKVDPVIKRLSEMLGKKVKKLETGNWKLSDRKKLAIVKKIESLRPGQVAMMENTRFSPDEKKNTGTLSQELAAIADIFVQECFAVAHRSSASIVGVGELSMEPYAGMLLIKEVKGLSKVLKKPKHPFVAVLGGAKVETKIPVMKNLLEVADTILIGGGLINTYLFATGYGIGVSLVDKNFAKEALKYCGKKQVIKPIDLLVGTLNGKSVRVVDIKRTPHDICKKDEGIYDIGPKTIRLFAEYIKASQTLVWNGAMGYFEQAPYDVGTLSIARLVASRSKGQAYGVIGGGETLQAMEMVGMTDDIDLVSTGGGAMLEFLAGETLPGIAAIS